MAKIIKKKYRTNAFTDLEKLRSIYKEDPMSLKLVDERDRQLREALNTAEVGEIPAIISLTHDAIDEIAKINHSLCLKKDLSEVDRKCLFMVRDVYEFFIDRLNAGQARNIIASVEGWASKHVEESK